MYMKKRRAGHRSKRTRPARHGGLSPSSGPIRMQYVNNEEVFRAELTGLEEVPPIMTNATGSFRARVAPNGLSLDYELTYANLTSQSTAAHIHFGQKGVNGEIIAFLCGGNSKPACPDREGTVTGTITAGDIRGIPEQGLAAGDIMGVIGLMRAGLTYINVHSTTFPGGEIRGQVHRS